MGWQIHNDPGVAQWGVSLISECFQQCLKLRDKLDGHVYSGWAIMSALDDYSMGDQQIFIAVRNDHDARFEFFTEKIRASDEWLKVWTRPFDSNFNQISVLGPRGCAVWWARCL